MKTKTENRKFALEKFEVAKLNNLRNIIGGTNILHDNDIKGPGDTDDQTPLSTRICNDSRNSVPPCGGTKKDTIIV